jgi:hypothetical protein
MIIANSEPDITSYEDKNNVIILPITKFVRKDGGIALVDEVSKIFLSKYPSLSKKWGYMTSMGIPFPSYSTNKTNLVGISDREHYASAFNESLLMFGLWYIREQSLSKPDKVFYMFRWPIDLLKKTFDGIDNIVYLKREEVSNEGQ